MELKGIDHSGPNLPRPMSGHCMEIINSSMIFLFDPDNANDTNTYLYDLKKGKWIKVIYKTCHFIMLSTIH